MRAAPTLLAAAALVCTGSAASAQESSATETLGVNGSAPQVCTIDTARIRAGELINFVGLDGDTLRVIDLTASDDLSAQAASAELRFDAVCNFPHRVRLESQENGLWPISGPVSPTSPEFATALPYLVRLNWADRTQLLEVDARVRRNRIVFTDIDAPAQGEMELRVEIDAGASNTQIGAPVLAGAYSDTLRIYLEPR